jgi:phosphate-selective porin OprO and OprP
MKLSHFLAISVAALMSSAPALANEGVSEQEVNAPSADKSSTSEKAPTAEKAKKSEWQIKPRWRLQYDIADIDGPTGLTGLGRFEDIRRTQLGVDIKMPNGFSARVEADFSPDPIEFVDAYLAWEGKGVNVIAGQHKSLTPLDDMTSDVNTSFMERAAFSTAFGYGRRTGISAGITKGDFAVNGGIFTEPLILLNDVKKNSVSADFRTYWSPKLGNSKLHLAAAYHWRDMNDLGDSNTRYRQRPLVRITDTRYIGTSGIIVEKEHKYGFEAAAVNGRFHGAAEVHWLKAVRPGFANPTFFGGYGEVGVFLTNDSRPLKGGAFGGIKPKKPLGSGGIGALQINVRYDYLDLNSKAVVGGKQNGYLASVIWTPIENIRLLFNYARLDYTDAAIAVAGDRNYAVDVIGVRGQLTF